MKKNYLTIFLFSILFLTFTTNVNAKEIETVNAKTQKNNITVSGKVEEGTLATAILVYKGDDLSYIETCGVNDKNEYSCKLNHEFEEGNYTLKVADYDGGNYKTLDIKIEKEKLENPPKTIDNIYLYLSLGVISLIGVIGVSIYFKKKIN